MLASYLAHLSTKNMATRGCFVFLINYVHVQMYIREISEATVVILIACDTNFHWGPFVQIRQNMIVRKCGHFLQMYIGISFITKISTYGEL